VHEYCEYLLSDDKLRSPDFQMQDVLTVLNYLCLINCD